MEVKIMTLAYLDSFAGMVPCKIVAVGDWSNDESEARIRITATRGAHKRGMFETVRLARLCPRSALYRSRQHCGQYRIRPYKWPVNG
jgi:hypothetical protein